MQAVIYSSGNQECERMASLLKTLDAQILEYRLNQHFSERIWLNLDQRQHIHKVILDLNTLVI